MATRVEDYRLSYDERAQSRAAGINNVIAELVGADPNQLTIRSAKNILKIFKNGREGCLDIGATWQVGDNFHWQSIRFNGENEAPLNENQLTVLGMIACSRATEVYDYSLTERRQNTTADATVHELSFESVTQKLPPQTATEAA